MQKSDPRFWVQPIFAIGNWLLAVSLLPMFIAHQLPAWQSSLPTGIILMLFSWAFFVDYKQWAGIATLTGCLIWLTAAALDGFGF